MHAWLRASAWTFTGLQLMRARTPVRGSARAGGIGCHHQTRTRESEGQLVLFLALIGRRSKSIVPGALTSPPLLACARPGRLQNQRAPGAGGSRYGATDGGRDRWLRGHADDSGQGHHHFASVSKESGNTPSRSAASAHHSVASSELPSRLLPLPFQVKEVKHLRIHGTEQLTPSVSRSVCLHLGWQRFWRRR